MVWPLDMASFREWAHDLEHIIVVEEKRKLIEVQIKEAIFDDRRGRRVTGWKNEAGETIFSVKQALDPVKIARTLGTLLALDGVETEALAARRALLDDAVRADNAEEIAVRKPWFCSGCPHNTSTRLPEGARAYAGIGCHYMVPLDGPRRPRDSPTWAARAPTGSARRRSRTAPHVFQNLGDGTYNHSGVQAIRAALAAGVNITYKILFNDAVAMTGGQPNEGGLTAQQIAHELVAMGVKHVVGVYDPKEEIDLKSFPPQMQMRERAELDAVQREMQEVAGRLRHHLHPDLRRREAPPPQARRSSPTPTAASSSTPTSARAAATAACSRTASRSCRSRPSSAASAMIDQSSCNKDFSCLDGFCPSFVTLEGAKVRKAEKAALALPDLPEPDAAADPRHLQHPHHRRRRHRRRHRRRADRHGRAPRGQGRRRDGDGRPRPEGRRGPHPLPHRRDARRPSPPSASRSARPTR